MKLFSWLLVDGTPSGSWLNQPNREALSAVVDMLVR
jgi:hypothetical protein